MIKFDKPFRNEEIYLSFFNSSALGYDSKNFFFAVFGSYFANWIRIRGSPYFCGSNESGSEALVNNKYSKTDKKVKLIHPL